MSSNRVVIDIEHSGRRIDNFLIGYYKSLPKSRIYQMVRRGEVRVNGGRVKQDYRLAAGDCLRLPPVTLPSAKIAPNPGADTRADLLERILYEDDGLIIIDKPAGMPVHAGSRVNHGLIELFRAVRGESLELVHRLDRATSGCLIIAKRPSSLRDLHELMRGQGMEKYYTALVRGKMAGGQPRLVDARLHKGAAPGGRRMVRVSQDGKQAQTYIFPVQRFKGATLTEIRLGTGRTHQIRAHTGHIGHPVAGDAKYGDREFNQMMSEFGLNRLFLHASALQFRLAGRKREVRVRAPLPQELQIVLERLRRGPAATASVADPG